MTLRPRLSIAAVALACALAAGCTGADSKPKYVFPTEKPASAAAAAWFAGEHTPIEAEAPSLEARFVAAEIDYWAGDVERAFDRHAAILSASPSHPLSRFSASRIHDLHDDVVDFESRARAVIENLTYAQVHPLTAIELSNIGQRVAWRSWVRSDSSEPFANQELGLPNRWRISPRMSAWRLLDFDTEFEPERQRILSEDYVAPVIAEDDPKNRRETRRWPIAGINMTPRPGATGVYYFETFATVLSNEDQVFWLSGNFAAATRVWIDGEEVLERREGDYGTGRRLRRVKLSPGTHRVLVKMAYQSGYRDWLDLVFLNAKGSPLGGSRLAFGERPPANDVVGKVDVLSEQKLPSDLEQVLVPADAIASASDMTLYLSALAAHDDRQSLLFEPAAAALSERAPGFAPIRALRSAHATTRWEVPSDKRDELSMTLLREAVTLDPNSLNYTIRLGSKLGEGGDEREVRALLERARDNAVDPNTGRLRNVIPLNLWAQHLEQKGWREDSERAWARALELAPDNCGGARRLQAAYNERSYYPKPADFFARPEHCPELYETWLSSQPDRHDEKLALLERDAKRFPFRSSHQLALARELRRRGDVERADAILDASLEWNPRSVSVHEERVDAALAERGPETALSLLDDYAREHGQASWAVFKAAAIKGEMPLEDLLQSGPDVARAIAAREASGEAAGTSEGDEAYYAIDFAARHYFPDSSSISVTHTMVRVMTKGAIDRFGEVSVPGNAHLLRARTVKADGTTRSPERTAGKATLSMPSLAPGDYIELAYLQFDEDGSTSRTHSQGTKFFFKMQDISSLHSEYVVINPLGDFIRRNDAPEAEAFTYQGQPAVRFVRRDSPRPVREPYTVSTDEYLPWVQQMRDGMRLDSFELVNRSMRDSIADAAKHTPEVDAQLDAWIALGEGKKGEERLKAIFYGITRDLPRATGSWSSDIAHGLATKSANPALAFYMAAERAGIEAELYFIRNMGVDPQLDARIASSAYGTRALRVAVPGEERYVWIAPVDQDSMFGALPNESLGQDAFCATCDEPTTTKVPTEGPVVAQRKAAIDATLGADGTLSGRVVETFTGTTAAYVRSVLRQRTEETARRKFIEARLSSYVPGSNFSNFVIDGTDDPDAPLSVSIDFTRPQWARDTGSGLRVETPIFRIALGSAYGSLPERSTPMYLSYGRNQAEKMTITLDDSLQAKLLSQSGSWSVDSPFGTYERSVTLDGSTLTIEASIDQPAQRVDPDQYPRFRDWSRATEYASLLAAEFSTK